MQLFTKILTAIARIAQIGILLVITCTFVSQKQFNERQLEFNRASLRPWVSFDPEIAVGFTRDTIHFNVAVSCIGRSPAQYVEVYSMLNYQEAYPESLFTQLINELRTSSNSLQSIIFPGETLWVYKDIKIPKIDDEIVSVNTFLTLIDSRRVFYHGYVEYKDADNHLYALRVTKQLKRSDKEKRYWWTYIKSSPQHLKLLRCAKS